MGECPPVRLPLFCCHIPNEMRYFLTISCKIKMKLIEYNRKGAWL